MNKYKHYKNDLKEIVNTDINILLEINPKASFTEKYNDPSGGEIKKGIVLDVEATGLSIS